MNVKQDRLVFLKFEARLIALERENQELREQISNLEAMIRVGNPPEFPDKNEVYVGTGRVPDQYFVPPASMRDFDANC